MRCEKAFGGAQDLEWAFAGGTLYLLQRRAVTSAMKKGTRGSVKVVSRRSQLITRALSHLDYSAYLSELWRADERTRTADLLITSELFRR